MQQKKWVWRGEEDRYKSCIFPQHQTHVAIIKLNHGTTQKGSWGPTAHQSRHSCCSTQPFTPKEMLLQN